MHLISYLQCKCMCNKRSEICTAPAVSHSTNRLELCELAWAADMMSPGFMGFSVPVRGPGSVSISHSLTHTQPSCINTEPNQLSQLPHRRSTSTLLRESTLVLCPLLMYIKYDLKNSSSLFVLYIYCIYNI